MKLIKIIIFLLISFNTSLIANSDDDLQNILTEGGKLIFIRHANAPGEGDPNNFDILSCVTQRNLDKKGIEQAKRIGKFFSKDNIEGSTVLSSEWCRCKQTAEYAFKKYETKKFLNSFYSKAFAHNKTNQINELRNYVQNWNGKSNLIFVTHYVVILEILNLSVSSGTIVVVDKNFKVLARQKIFNN